MKSHDCVFNRVGCYRNDGWRDSQIRLYEPDTVLINDNKDKNDHPSYTNIYLILVTARLSAQETER